MGIRSNKIEFEEKARKIHGDKYDYSKVEYVNNKTKVCIICPIHGEFWQRPNDHLSGNGCKICNNEYKPTTEEWVEKAKKVHNNKYDYSKVEYVSAFSKVCIVCHTHGDFWQSPVNHLFGKCGCPMCNSNKKSVLERTVEKILNENSINYEREKTFEWLINKSNLYLDFYLPKYCLGIECQGEQHYRPIEKFGGEKEFLKIKERDSKKLELCELNGINIIYINRKNIKNDIINMIYEATNKEKLC